MTDLFPNINFQAPYFLGLLTLVPLAAYWFWKNKSNYYPTLKFSRVDELRAKTSLRSRLADLLSLILKTVAITLIIIALARPQNVFVEESVKAEGIDIVLVMDLSSSMLARDFKPDRLEVSKEVAMEFVSKRNFDRIALVVFAGQAYTQCPLTTDQNILDNFLSGLKCGLLEDGTAIGMGLATAVNRLKNSERESKVIILLTDGINNTGYVQPRTAAQMAQQLDMKVYTIGVGSSGEALTPVARRSNGEYQFGLAPVEIDETLLLEIAEKTNGKYFRATSKQALINIYNEIDQLEKSEIEVTVFKRYSEAFFPLTWLALIAIVIEFILKNTLFRTMI